MTSRPRGICLIINNITFQCPLLGRRDGADVDEYELNVLFQHLHFNVFVGRDLTVDDIRTTAQEFAAKDHSQFDAFVFFILSHGGSNDVIFGVKGGTISVAELMCFFKPTDCPTLQNKPKLFFIQTCRGALGDRNLTASGTVPPSSQTTVTGAQTSYVSALSRSTCPEEVDFLLAFSTAPGYISVLSNRRGSPFIQVTR